MAPELFPLIDMEDEEVDRLFSKEADVYAFAMVCFEVRLWLPESNIPFY